MKKRPTSILYIIPNSSINHTPVLQTQVLYPAQYLDGRGYQVAILCYEPRDKEIQPVSSGVNSNAIRRYKIDANSFLLRLVLVTRQAIDICRNQNIDFIYFRNIWGGLVGVLSRSKGIELIFDLRALIAEESAFRHNTKFPGYYLLKMIERFLIKKADRISVVSNKLKEYVLSIESDKPIYLVPSAVDTDRVYYSEEERSNIRSSYGIDPQEIVLVYIGGVSKWQQVDETIQLFRDLDCFCDNLRLMLIVQNISEIRDRLVSIFPEHPGNIILVENIGHGEVYRYLSAADVGIVLRENHILNRVASPIKFAEYLACGLPVILTPWVGDYSDIVPQKRLGLVISPDDPNKIEKTAKFLEDLAEDPDSYKIACQRYAEENLSIEAIGKSLESIFRIDING